MKERIAVLCNSHQKVVALLNAFWGSTLWQYVPDFANLSKYPNSTRLVVNADTKLTNATMKFVLKSKQDIAFVYYRRFPGRFLQDEIDTLLMVPATCEPGFILYRWTQWLRDSYKPLRDAILTANAEKQYLIVTRKPVTVSVAYYDPVSKPFFLWLLDQKKMPNMDSFDPNCVSLLWKMLK